MAFESSTQEWDYEVFVDDFENKQIRAFYWGDLKFEGSLDEFVEFCLSHQDELGEE
jgi:hypothetical protein